MSAIKCYGYSPAQIPGVWPLMESHLYAACEHDIARKLTTGTLYAKCIESKAVLISISVNGDIVGAAVVSPAQVDKGAHLLVDALGGKYMSLWLDDFVAYLETVAKVNSCKNGILFYGRIGWQKQLKRLGFETVMVTMRKECRT